MVPGETMKKFLLSVGLVLLSVTAAFAQGTPEYVDVPLTDSAYTDLAVVTSAGIMDCCYGGSCENRGMTRHEFAVATARLLKIGLFSANMPVDHTASGPDGLVILAATKRLAVKFAPEMKALGVRLELIKINGEFIFNSQFDDVPAGHWAYDAVLTLRRSGILIGVPAELKK